MPGFDWSTVNPRVSDFKEGGIPQTALDEYGNDVAVIGADGRPVWDIPPYVTIRLASTVSHNGGSSVTYVYTLENFTDLERDFEFPGLRTPENPQGWSGTVDANETLTDSFTVASPGEDLWETNTQGTVVSSDDSEEELARPLRVYAPESRVAFTGQTIIVSAVHDGPNTCNRIVFQVTAPATEAYLVWVNGPDVAIVAELHQSIALGTDTVLEHELPPSGPNDYYVMAGIDVTGSASDTVTVSTP